MEIPFYVEGANSPSLWSCADRNVEVALLRALANITIEQGDHLEAQYSNNGIKLIVPATVAPTTNVTSSTASNGLTHAVWHSAQKKIYGCKGGYLFEFDASANFTGKSIAFAQPYLGDSFLAIDGNGDVWASYWDDFAGGEGPSSKGLYQIGVTGPVLLLKKFVPFPQKANQDYTSFSLNGYTLHTAFSNPWGVWAIDFPVGPDYSTSFNVGAAAGDAFYKCCNGFSPGGEYAWIGTWGGAPVATDWYIATNTLVTTPGPHFYYAINHQAAFGPPDIPVDLTTQAVGRGNPIVHLNAGDVLSVNAPQNSPSFWETIFGFTGTVSTTGTVGYMSSYREVGPRRIAFGTNGHLYTGFIDSSVATGFGLAPHYFGTPFPNVYELDVSGFGSVVTNANGTGDDINGWPGLNAWWQDPSNNDIWVGIGPGIAQLVAASGLAVNAFIEVPALVHQSHGWYDGMVYGLDFCSSNGLFYMVTKTNVVYTVPISSAVAASCASFTISGRPDMRPRNIRYSSRKNRLYIPTMSDNAVVEVDPTTNTVSNIFVGFDAPWDIVDTGSSIYAVSLGKTPLQLVTT